MLPSKPQATDWHVRVSSLGDSWLRPKGVDGMVTRANRPGGGARRLWGKMRGGAVRNFGCQECLHLSISLIII